MRGAWRRRGSSVSIPISLFVISALCDGSRPVPAAIEQLGAALKAPLGGMPYSATIGVSVSIGSALAAFLLAYLWTSIRVRELLEDSERESQGGVVPKLVGTNDGRGKTDSRNHSVADGSTWSGSRRSGHTKSVP